MLKDLFVVVTVFAGVYLSRQGSQSNHGNCPLQPVEPLIPQLHHDGIDTRTKLYDAYVSICALFLQ